LTCNALPPATAMTKADGASPKKAARSAGLQYVSDDAPGITRIGRNGHFHYRGATGKPVRDRAALARIRRLAIPPAWKKVWIAATADAHLQATGRDVRGRKQYLYHPEFAAVRDAAKFSHLVEFAQTLPAIRRRIGRDLNRRGLPREKILAAVVGLLEDTLIRVGNEDYARANHSYGLTTLRNRHARVRGSEIRFLFRGKSGKEWSLSLRNRRIAKVVRSCQELSGQHLFEYRNGDGTVHRLTSSDVNAYLQQISGHDITAKDFRTWAGTVKAAMGLLRATEPPSKRLVRSVVAEVAEELGNTVAICRKCYIHPRLISDFEAGKLSLRVPARGQGGLDKTEVAVLNYLKRAP
jgi:DNA topoisomerase-1